MFPRKRAIVLLFFLIKISDYSYENSSSFGKTHSSKYAAYVKHEVLHKCIKFIEIEM